MCAPASGLALSLAAMVVLAWSAGARGDTSAELRALSLWADAPERFRGATPCDADAFAARTRIQPPRALDPNGTGPSRALVPLACNWSPPVLWSFPGSGNTWMRQMLETATDFATGSVYNDNSLLGIFPAERHCAPDVLVVKAHAVHTPFELLRYWARPAVAGVRRSIPWHGGLTDAPGKRLVHLTFRNFLGKCARWRAERALVIDREPYGAIWSEFQRRFVEGDNGGHVARVRPAEFDERHWLRSAERAAAGYVASITSHLSFARDVGRAAGAAAAAAARGATPRDAAAATAAGASGAVALVPFADLSARCEATLRRVLSWLAPPVGGGVAGVAGGEAEGAYGWRIAQACNRTDRSIKRSAAAGHGAEPYVRAADAWSELAVCRVWAVLGHTARALGHAPPRPCHSRDELALALARGRAPLPPSLAERAARGDGGGGNGATHGAADRADLERADPVLFVSAAAGELDVCLNWLLAALPAPRRAAAIVEGNTDVLPVEWGGRLLIGAEGWAEFDALGALGAPAFPLIPRFVAHGGTRDHEGDGARDGVRVERAEVAAALVGEGHAVVLAEPDALWGGTDVAGALARAAAVARADLVALAAPRTRASPGVPATAAHVRARLALALARWSPTKGARRLLAWAVREGPTAGGDEGALNALLDSARDAVWSRLSPDVAKGGLGGWVVALRLPPGGADGADGAGGDGGGGGGAEVRLLILTDAVRLVSCEGPDAGSVLADADADAADAADAARARAPRTAAALVARCAPRPAAVRARALRAALGGALAQRLRRGGLWVLPAAWHTLARGVRPEQPPAAVPADVARAALAARGDGAFSRAVRAWRDALRIDASIVVSCTWASASLALLAAPDGGDGDGGGGARAARGARAAIDVQQQLDELALNLATGAARAALRLELVAVAWHDSAGARAPSVLPPELPAALRDALRVRVVRVRGASHERTLRRYARAVRTLETAALNVGIRAACAELILAASFGAQFVEPFFAALLGARVAREPASALAPTALGAPRAGGLRAFLVRACALPAGAPSSACDTRALASAASAGLLMPAALWHAARGLSEAVASAPHADRYLASALEALSVAPQWLPCPPGACARAPARGWARWWRVGPAAVAKLDSVAGALRARASNATAAASDDDGAGGGARCDANATTAVHTSSLDAEREVALLVRARAGAGIDGSCRWGLVGHVVALAERRADGVGVAERDALVADVEALADAPPSGGCTSRSAEAAAWATWSAYASRARPLLVVHVEGGLGNRLRALASGWALADALGYAYAIVWEPNTECDARFDELFAPDERFITLSAKPAAWPTRAWAEYDPGDAMPMLTRAHSTGTNVYVRTQQLLRSRVRRHSLQAYAERFAWLRPRAELGALVQQIAREALLRLRVGVHVRMTTDHTSTVFGVEAGPTGGSGGGVGVSTDARATTATTAAAVAASHFAMDSAEAAEAYATRRRACHWRYFAATMRRLVRATGGGARFYVACDDAACYNGLRAAVGAARVGSITDHVPCARAAGCTVDSRSAPCQALGLVEISLLSLSRHVLLSQPSSFSDAARALLYGRWLNSTRQGAPRLPGPFAHRASVQCGAPLNFRLHLNLEGFEPNFHERQNAGLPIAQLVERMRSGKGTGGRGGRGGQRRTA
ncbi:hypothetical protein KFE25_011859 [Diacronema lutheri]|uniref:Fucosyltransferase n=4 Tax=Diacronema lutheri TaxID=2081491 RepID=A0A8J5X6C7_DIALT|nr:hypothetical protein KFE25_011859 [Diacronema lutheri]